MALEQGDGPPGRPSQTEDELNHLRRQAAKYERQNKRLRMLLDSFIAGQESSQTSETLESAAPGTAEEPTLAAAPPPPPPPPPPGCLYRDAGTNMGEEREDESWETQYLRLSKQYDLMSRQANYYKKSFDERDQKYKTQKKLLREWRQWYDSYAKQSFHAHHPKQAPDELYSRTWSAIQKSKSPSIAARTPQPMSGTTQGETKDQHFDSSGGNLQLQSPVSDTRGADDQQTLGCALESPTKARLERNLSSQATEDENASPSRPAFQPQAPPGSEDGSDDVQLVSERRVQHATRRPRTGLARPKTSEEASPTRGIKFESSSPINVKEFPNEESVDLDEISGQVKTPSKRQRLQSASRQAFAEAPPIISRRISTSKSLGGAHHGLANASRITTERSGDNERHQTDMEHPVNHQRRQPLQPVSANERSDFQQRAIPNSKKRKNIERLAKSIESLAEGGETMSPSALPSTSRQEFSAKRQKLENLLSPRLPATDGAPQFFQEAPQITSTQRRRWPPKPSVEKRPLRETSLSVLGLDDFRINPNAPSNDGLGYAFSETVRGREARRCLPGCTDPQCCGNKFQKMVEIGGVNPTVRRSLGDDGGLDDSRPNHGAEERQLLEHYFGRDAGAQQRIAAMTSAERRRAVINAKATLLSEQYGKHRHAFQRRTTPPGFWRTDMPSTQEQAQDREQQDAAVRERVRERWDEAMRAGRESRWVFRDELQGR